MSTPILFPNARTNDPGTSHLAAQRADGFAGKHRERIAAVLQDALAHGMTAGEIGDRCGLSVEQVDHGIHQMQRHGLLKRVGMRFCEVKGEHMSAWRLLA